jgi:hypothetical protein
MYDISSDFSINRSAARSVAPTVPAETDRYAPDLTRENSSIDAPGTFAEGSRLTADLVEPSIRFLAGIVARLCQFRIMDWSRHPSGSSSPVSHYDTPFISTGNLRKVTVTMDGEQVFAGAAVARVAASSGPEVAASLFFTYTGTFLACTNTT